MSVASGGGETVEIFELGGGSGAPSCTINGAEVKGADSSSETAGAIIPTKTNEKGYDWNFRTGPESIDAEISGRVNAADLAPLKRLRDEKEPFSMASFTTQLPRVHIPEGGLSIDTVDGYPGAYEVTVKLTEIQQGSTGSATIRAVSDSGSKGPKAGSDGGGQQGIVQTSGGKNGNTGKAGDNGKNSGGNDGDGGGGGGFLSGIGNFLGGLT